MATLHAEIAPGVKDDRSRNGAGGFRTQDTWAERSAPPSGGDRGLDLRLRKSPLRAHGEPHLIGLGAREDRAQRRDTGRVCQNDP